MNQRRSYGLSFGLQQANDLVGLNERKFSWLRSSSSSLAEVLDLFKEDAEQDDLLENQEEEEENDDDDEQDINKRAHPFVTSTVSCNYDSSDKRLDIYSKTNLSVLEKLLKGLSSQNPLESTNINANDIPSGLLEELNQCRSSRVSFGLHANDLVGLNQRKFSWQRSSSSSLAEVLDLFKKDAEQDYLEENQDEAEDDVDADEEEVNDNLIKKNTFNENFIAALMNMNSSFLNLSAQDDDVRINEDEEQDNEGEEDDEEEEDEVDEGNSYNSNEWNYFKEHFIAASMNMNSPFLNLSTQDDELRCSKSSDVSDEKNEISHPAERYPIEFAKIYYEGLQRLMRLMDRTEQSRQSLQQFLESGDRMSNRNCTDIHFIEQQEHTKHKKRRINEDS